MPPPGKRVSFPRKTLQPNAEIRKEEEENAGQKADVPHVVRIIHTWCRICKEYGNAAFFLSIPIWLKSQRAVYLKMLACISHLRMEEKLHIWNQSVLGHTLLQMLGSLCPLNLCSSALDGYVSLAPVMSRGISTLYSSKGSFSRTEWQPQNLVSHSSISRVQNKPHDFIHLDSSRIKWDNVANKGTEHKRIVTAEIIRMNEFVVEIRTDLEIFRLTPTL